MKTYKVLQATQVSAESDAVVGDKTNRIEAIHQVSVVAMGVDKLLELLHELVFGSLEILGSQVFACIRRRRSRFHREPLVVEVLVSVEVVIDPNHGLLRDEHDLLERTFDSSICRALFRVHTQQEGDAVGGRLYNVVFAASSKYF